MGIDGIENLIDKKGITVSRNAFEHNEAEIPHEELMELSDKMFALMPALPEGQQYELRKLGDGRVAVIIAKDV